MSTPEFIARKLRFKGRMALVATAVSFLVMIISVAISAGFRQEIRAGIAGVAGDVTIDTSTELELPEGMTGIASVEPVVYQTGIVKVGDNIQGVMLKGSAERDSLELGVVIPERLSEMLGLNTGDPMLTYFVGEDKVKARKFTVAGTYDSPVEADDRMVVLCSISDLRRVADLSEDECTAVEVRLAPQYASDFALQSKTEEIGISVHPARVQSSKDRYPQLFDWLNLIDFNVFAIIALMTVVAGFNMISALLILLFRSISTIGTLKALGMKDRSIAAVFLRVSARMVGLGMLIGNAVAFVLCFIQDKTHILKLNPENYFVSFVPVSLNVGAVLVADAVAFVVIMLLLLIPTLFISKVDPARTVRAA